MTVQDSTLLSDFLGQVSDLWEPATPPANGRPPPKPHGRHGHPQPSLAAPVGEGGAWERMTPQIYCWGIVGSVPSHPGGGRYAIRVD